MGYIKFCLSTRKTDDVGNTTGAVISRIESDMADTGMLETNLIMHALSARGGKEGAGAGGGFSYTFPFVLGFSDETSVFPYTFPFELT